jgi:uncharacterized membrane protein
MQLAQVLEMLALRGQAVIAGVYMEHLTPNRAPGPSAPEQRHGGQIVRWDGRSGVVQQLDLRRLIEQATNAGALVIFRVGVGDVVHRDTTLAEVHGGVLPDGAVRASIVRAPERTFDQDPGLALRLLADIAMRALSPAVNDPATAVDALAATEDLLCLLADRDLDVNVLSDDSGVPRIQLRLPTWDQYLEVAVGDLLPCAAPFRMVLERIQALLDHLSVVAPPFRQPPLDQLREAVTAGLTAIGSGPRAPARTDHRFTPSA